MALVLAALYGLGPAFDLIGRQFLGWRTNMDTRIARQTNAYRNESRTTGKGGGMKQHSAS
jgi:hypothetical protein